MKNKIFLKTKAFFSLSLSPVNMNKVFNLEDYKELNKDLQFNQDAQYLHHWNKIGMKQCRLCNKLLLIVSNEFGIEILFNIGYYYYLFTNHLLFDNKITTYRGMEAYYYFLPKEQLILRNQTRTWIPTDQYLLTVYLKMNNDSAAITNFYDIHPLYWKAPDYISQYKSNLFQYDKPLLIVNNKYNKEWERTLNKPVNFLDIPCLDQIFDYLTSKYQVVYIRCNDNIKSSLQYSFDNNKNLPFDDFSMIRSKHPNVILFDDLLNKKEFQQMNYNLLKCYLFASCTKYISVQGGANNLISYFAKSILIYHKFGFEAETNVYTVRSKLQSRFADFLITHRDDYNEFIKAMKMIY